ncbi:hypothetical protein Desti_0773 [Desulfomonile tiedjei DSM 6799]|uniref:Uncharacterized protein n=1 Tax=Desulfomonile tiedjei (strain ATCC 49306 / DSM 6799 / DCB-1) TaxID=706587 RepID=I4C1Q7_DESTA|nr:hypothetical protein Desti_0773 [Desulfomonile tiedjei DSM 6799]
MRIQGQNVLICVIALLMGLAVALPCPAENFPCVGGPILGCPTVPVCSPPIVPIVPCCEPSPLFPPPPPIVAPVILGPVCAPAVVPYGPPPVSVSVSPYSGQLRHSAPR